MFKNVTEDNRLISRLKKASLPICFLDKGKQLFQQDSSMQEIVNFNDKSIYTNFAY